jgi:hypothetical protein
MKKCILIAAVALGIIACSDSDGEVGLAGTWKLRTYTFYNPIDINGDSIAGNSLITETGCFSNTTMVFDEEGTVVLNDQTYSMDTTGVVCDSLIIPVTGSYNRSAENVTVNAGGAAKVFVKSGDKLTRVIEGDNGAIIQYFKQ